MGNCSSAPSQRVLVLEQEETDIPISNETQGEVAATAMSEKSNTMGFNNFLAANNVAVEIANRTCQQLQQKVDTLSKQNQELQTCNEQLRKDNQSLRQRINNDSEMNHRGYQSISEDVTSKNKRSDVISKYEVMDGAHRKKAIEAFGKKVQRTELWYRKDLTCRIFVVAFDTARSSKDAFDKGVLPQTFQWASSLGANYEMGRPNGSLEVLQPMERNISEELASLLSDESFRIVCSSVLKEIAVNCNLTDLEEKTLKELKAQHRQWREHDPWLPYLDEDKLSKMKNFVTECVRLAWRMVNLLPPLKIVMIPDVQGEKFDEFFEKEEEEVKEGVPTMTVCVWPALTDSKGDEVLVRGKAAIIPKPKLHSSV
ncbi:uncharacterized protein LOC111328475 [Stylophora pistillata]|uniref:Mitochondria-eating protein n=1 Tax=Stylophora pistillata TaxID=50429 RepID=A0A2B4SE47_STYPI|nr:uncharacterized protein LOC111328475 [Stylophora pistillata]PFX26812.1 hypothetical protein AWC38_SpisGene8491 [Stylophora pistillata]